MIRKEGTCASCNKFDIAQAEQNAGLGTCSGYERPAGYADRFCVLYVRAKDLERRKAAVVRLNQMQKPLAYF